MQLEPKISISFCSNALTDNANDVQLHSMTTNIIIGINNLILLHWCVFGWITVALKEGNVSMCNCISWNGIERNGSICNNLFCGHTCRDSLRERQLKIFQHSSKRKRNYRSVIMLMMTCLGPFFWSITTKDDGRSFPKERQRKIQLNAVVATVVYSTVHRKWTSA